MVKVKGEAVNYKNNLKQHAKSIGNYTQIQNNLNCLNCSMSEIWIYVLICAGALFAGFIDAVVGGGGLVQVPLLLILFPQFSHVQVIATNRFASLAGTSVAAFHFIRSVGVDTAVVLTSGITSAITAFAGTFVMKLIAPDVFKPILLLVIVLLAVYTFIKKDFGVDHLPRYKGTKLLIVCGLIGAALGFYNGFIGPGTGSLLVFSLVSIAGMSFLHASSSAKIINAIADAASLVGFLMSKAVVFKIAIPMMVCNMLGSYIGSKAAILKGSAFIRYIFILVMAILILRLGWDVFGKKLSTKSEFIEFRYTYLFIMVFYFSSAAAIQFIFQ